MRPAIHGDAMAIVSQLIRQLQSGPAVAPMFPMLIFEEISTRPWTSVTFAGELHRIDLLLRGAAVEVSDVLDRLVLRLAADDWTFDLPGAIVASVRLMRLSLGPDPAHADVALTFEVLTVVD